MGEGWGWGRIALAVKGWDWEGRVERVGVETRVVSLLTMGKETREKEEGSRKEAADKHCVVWNRRRVEHGVQR